MLSFASSQFTLSVVVKVQSKDGNCEGVLVREEGEGERRVTVNIVKHKARGQTLSKGYSVFWHTVKRVYATKYP